MREYTAEQKDQLIKDTKQRLTIQCIGPTSYKETAIGSIIWTGIAALLKANNLTPTDSTTTTLIGLVVTATFAGEFYIVHENKRAATLFDAKLNEAARKEIALKELEALKCHISIAEQSARIDEYHLKEKHIKSLKKHLKNLKMATTVISMKFMMSLP